MQLVLVLLSVPHVAPLRISPSRQGISMMAIMGVAGAAVGRYLMLDFKYVVLVGYKHVCGVFIDVTAAQVVGVHGT